MEQTEENSLILLRGLPGSGKSRLAAVLSENGKYPVCSVDQYFTDPDGNYHFRYAENHLAYERCRQCVQDEVKRQTKRIFVDNTFTLDWELEPYFQIAGESAYSIYVVTVENYHGGKNIHGITDQQLRKMAEKYKVRLIP